MTVAQESYLRLYERGYGVNAIAQMLGKSKSTVSTVLKLARTPKKDKPLESAACTFSPSCFTCPLGDCGLKQSEAVRVNVLPIGFEYVRAIGI